MTTLFRERMTTLGLKSTRQREVIAERFLEQKEHVTADELLGQLRVIDQQISLATVYRTLNLLQECGLATVHEFGDGFKRFEPSLSTNEHHDHLICTKCSIILEFVNSQIERLQESVAKKHGFQVQRHKLEIYGLCATCKVSG